jgi:uroporphyrinogen-III synthase
VIRRILILRPEPGAGATAARARRLGFEPVVAPLFTVVPVAWDQPDPGAFDALLLTSGNAARHSGSELSHLPCYAVGEATAEAARRAGYRDLHTGPSDGAAAAAMIAADGHRHALHLCGRDHIEISVPGLTVERRIVYAAEPVAALPDAARQALTGGAPALLHSPRAASLFASFVEDRRSVAIIAISQAAADAAGPGWALKAIAAAPRDEALLELAVQLCQTKDQTHGRDGNGG